MTQKPKYFAEDRLVWKSTEGNENRLQNILEDRNYNPEHVLATAENKEAFLEEAGSEEAATHERSHEELQKLLTEKKEAVNQMTRQDLSLLKKEIRIISAADNDHALEADEIRQIGKAIDEIRQTGDLDEEKTREALNNVESWDYVFNSIDSGEGTVDENLLANREKINEVLDRISNSCGVQLSLANKQEFVTNLANQSISKLKQFGRILQFLEGVDIQQLPQAGGQNIFKFLGLKIESAQDIVDLPNQNFETIENNFENLKALLEKLESAQTEIGQSLSTFGLQMPNVNKIMQALPSLQNLQSGALAEILGGEDGNLDLENLDINNLDLSQINTIVVEIKNISEKIQESLAVAQEKIWGMLTTGIKINGQTIKIPENTSPAQKAEILKNIMPAFSDFLNKKFEASFIDSNSTINLEGMATLLGKPEFVEFLAQMISGENEEMIAFLTNSQSESNNVKALQNSLLAALPPEVQMQLAAGELQNIGSKIQEALRKGDLDAAITAAFSSFALLPKLMSNLDSLNGKIREFAGDVGRSIFPPGLLNIWNKIQSALNGNSPSTNPETAEAQFVESFKNFFNPASVDIKKFENVTMEDFCEDGADLAALTADGSTLAGFTTEQLTNLQTRIRERAAETGNQADLISETNVFAYLQTHSDYLQNSTQTSTTA